MMLLLVAGCGVPKRVVEPKPKPLGPARTVHTGAGEATRRSEDEDRAREWEIRWQGANLEVAPDGAVGGSMEGLQGVLFREDVAVSDFSAEFGEADPESGLLQLRGGVKVIAREGGTTLTCETLEWRARQNIVVAKGTVKIESKMGVVGPFAELWANGDLDVAGTPDWFQENNR